MSLGELQQMAMLAVARVAPEAWGTAIRDELAEVAGREVSIPTVYVTLVRLEEQGLVASSKVPREDGVGGPPRRIFELTDAGWEALEQARAAMGRMWRGVVRP